MKTRLLGINRRQFSRTTSSAATRRPRTRTRLRSSFLECLEERQLLAASLAPIPNLNVPALQGFTQPLDGSGTSNPQSFSATSSNPDISVSVVSTTFWTVGVSYTDPNVPGNSFTGTLTFGLFGNLTPETVAMISEFTNDNYYVDTGKYLARIVTDFAGTTSSVVQGGASVAVGEGGPSGQPGTPFANEILQALAPTGNNQLLMSNAGGTDSNDTQFFIDTGPLDNQLAYEYTLFGQLVAGAPTLARIAAVPVTNNTVTGETSQPINPITITSTTLSTASSNGVLLIDTTQARVGETATISVTAHDSNGTPTEQSQSFQVTVGPYSGPSNPTINFKPYALPVTATTAAFSSAPIQLDGQATYPAPTVRGSSFTLVTAPSHGTISSFNPATGTLIYTPAPGFVGTDTFTYIALSNGPSTIPSLAASNPATVTINVGDVTLNAVEVFTNDTGKVSKIELYWSGPLETPLAKSKAPYVLELANRKGSYTGKGAATIAIRKVLYDASTDTVTLTPATPFSKFKIARVLVHGSGRNALKGSHNLPISGDNGPSTSATWSLTYP